MKAALLVSLLALAVAAAAAVWLVGENAELRDRMAALEVSVGAAPQDGDGHSGGAAPGLHGAAARREVAELRGTADALMTRMDALEARAKDGAARPAAGAVDVGTLTGSADFAEAVRELVLAMAKDDVDFRARIGTADRTKLKDVPFRKVAETLKLDGSQESAMRKDLQGIQQELFTLLQQEREDGVVPLELIGQAEGLGPGDPRRGALLMKALTLKIPGKDETYLQRAITLAQGFRTKADAYLRAEQKEILDGVEIDWFSIKFD